MQGRGPLQPLLKREGIPSVTLRVTPPPPPRPPPTKPEGGEKTLGACDYLLWASPQSRAPGAEWRVWDGLE